MAPDLGGLGRGVGALVALDTIVGVHRADHAAGLARRLDDGLEHKSGRGLSLGTGDAHDLNVVVGAVVDLRRQQGHGRAHAVHDQHRRAALLRQRLQRLDQRLFAHKCDGARIERHAQKRGLKGSALAKEDVTRRNRARIKRTAGHGALVNLLRSTQLAAHIEQLDKRIDRGHGRGIRMVHLSPFSAILQGRFS